MSRKQWGLACAIAAGATGVTTAAELHVPLTDATRHLIGAEQLANPVRSDAGNNDLANRCVDFLIDAE